MWYDVENPGWYDIGQDNELESLLQEAASGEEYVMPPGAGYGQNRLSQALRSSRQPQVVTRGPTKAREYPIGFVGTSLAAAGSETITRRPQVPFKGKRLITASNTAGSFEITDIKVGKNSQLVSANNIPALAFAETAQGVEMDFDTCQVSMDLAIGITNISLAAATFRAAIVGVAVE